MELRGFSHSKLLTDKFEVFSTLSSKYAVHQTPNSWTRSQVHWHEIFQLWDYILGR